MNANLVWTELSNGNIGPICIGTAVMQAVVGFASIVSGKTRPVFGTLIFIMHSFFFVWINTITGISFLSHKLFLLIESRP
jgi:hypothetical protein